MVGTIEQAVEKAKRLARAAEVVDELPPPFGGRTGLHRMAAFHFELVSPDKLLFNGPAQSVLVPGSDGDFQVLSDHAPVMTVAASRRRRHRGGRRQDARAISCAAASPT